MQTEIAINAEPQKFSLRSRLSVGLGILGLGLIGSTCFAANPADAQRIFRCEFNGRTIYSDQPCATAPSTEVVLRSTNSYHAETSAVVPPSTHKAARSDRQPTRQTDAIAVELQRAQLNCQRLADQLVNIENTMRSGYSAKQGERLRERQRQLEQRRRTEHCR
jgi:hypothetical protein